MSYFSTKEAPGTSCLNGFSRNESCSETACHSGRLSGFQKREVASSSVRLADLDEIERGLRRNLSSCLKREDWQGAINQIEGLARCANARRELLR